jgi:hypothetical protein
VSIGQLVLFSSESGDAWMLDPSKHLAVRLASMGTLSRSVSKTATPPSQLPGRGHYRIVGPAFLYTDRDKGRASTMFGYPTRKLAQMGATGGSWSRNALHLSRAGVRISNMFG